jgi:hypothetical protein
MDSLLCLALVNARHTCHRTASCQRLQVCYCKKCSGLVKPDIVFFGEHLPDRFFTHKTSDLAQAELLIIMGTSLVVHPFASLADDVHEHCPRLLINREVVGTIPQEMRALGFKNGLWFGEGNVRDAKFLGDCDTGVAQFARHLGWEDDFADLVGHCTEIRKAQGGSTAAALEEPDRDEHREDGPLRSLVSGEVDDAAQESEAAVEAAMAAMKRVHLSNSAGP